MNLVASLIVRNELSRYLLDCLELLLGFCDEVRIVDDDSTDGTYSVLADMDRVKVTPSTSSRFYAHEGAARQRALEWTLDAKPTHILAVDGDELIENGQRLRMEVEEDQECPVWTLCMEEVWKADEEHVWIRQDGGWKAHSVPILYRVNRKGGLEIPQRALASGRVPVSVARDWRKARSTGASILHLGWANVAERAARHARYVEHDGGQFHASAHLDSIMWPDEKVTLSQCPWSTSIPRQVRERVVARVNLG